MNKVGVVSFYVRGADGETEKNVKKPADGTGTTTDETDYDRQERIRTSTYVVEDMLEFLENEGVEHVVNAEIADELDCDAVGLNELEDTDFVVTVGGDGTILRAVGAMDEPVPILGVNTGRVGFLADVPPESAVDEVERILDGFETERRSRLAVEVNGEHVATALNECVVVASRPAKILEFDVYHAGELVESVRS
ncbi:MAG: NAD(+)/NADH kinase, partial [Halobacteria archaeon]|nr:NAD(+)/NADH kinase [Halobacteria archaeon]